MVFTPPWATTQQLPCSEEPTIGAPTDQSLVSPVAAQVQEIWDRDGWDYRVSPRDSWRRYHGITPFPDVAAFATQPTFGPIDDWLQDQSITDLHLNGPGHELLARRSGDTVELAMHQTWHRDWYLWLVDQFRARGRGRSTDTQLSGTAVATRPGQRPCVLRYEIVLPPLCEHGPVLAIRVLRPGTLSLEKLVQLETITHAGAEFLACCTRANVDVFITGTANVGKTTLAQALLATITDQRLICIEDVPEIVVASDRCVNLALAAVDAVGFADLIRSALRMNANRIVVGETRGHEAYAVLAAARNGYPVLTTLHGDSAKHGLHNLAVMAMEANETHAQLEVIYAMINARPSVVVSVARRDGRRQVMEIVEVQRQFGSSRPVVETLYGWEGDQFRRSTPMSHALRERLDMAGALPETDRW